MVGYGMVWCPGVSGSVRVIDGREAATDTRQTQIKWEKCSKELDKIQKNLDGVRLWSGWPGDRVAGWPGGRVTGWPGAGWPGDRVAGWPGGRVTGWPGGRVAGWPGDRVTK